MKKLLTALLLTTSAMSAVASTSPLPTDLKLPNPNEPLGEYVDMPIKSLKAVHTKGRVFYVSENGRYIFSGEVYDIWRQSKLNSFEEVKLSATRIDFDKMKIDLDRLNTISIGTGSKVVTVFVDPRCDVCHKLISDINKRALLKEYTFKLVVVPALGDESNKQARALFCAEDKKDAFSALRSNTLLKLKQKEECDTAMYDQTLLLTHFMGVEAVPYLVSHDGRQHRGRPAKIKDFLEPKAGTE